MFTVAKLRRNPRQFQALTGLSVAEFDQLLIQFAPAYEAARHQRQLRPGRERSPGAGHPFTLALDQRLLMGLLYFRLYVNQSLLSVLFDVDQSSVSREVHQRVLPVLLGVLPVPLRDAPLRDLVQEPERPAQAFPVPRRKGKRIGTLKELLEAYPQIEELLIDATEQSIPQPQDKQKRKQAYSGKQQDHTLKTQIVATSTRLLHVFGGVPGSVHDVTVLAASGVLHQVPKTVQVRVDRGYQGADKYCPAAAVVSPVRKVRAHAVSVLGKAYNYLLSVLRMPVEHHFARLKRFRILADIYRGDQNRHEDLFCVIAGLLNFRATGQFTLA
jgi:hypothetical protein